MKENLLEAVSRAVAMVSKSGYRWPEALDYAAIAYDLDEFEADDLEVLARGQHRRLMKQMEKNYD